MAESNLRLSRRAGRIAKAEIRNLTVECESAEEISLGQVGQVSERCWPHLKAAPVRVALPDILASASRTLEDAYYPGAEEILVAARKLL